MYGSESDCAPPSAAAKVYAYLRIAFALLILATLAYQLHLNTTRYHIGVVPFFGYFTVLSNILLATAFLLASFRMLGA